MISCCQFLFWICQRETQTYKRPENTSIYVRSLQSALSVIGLIIYALNRSFRNSDEMLPQRFMNMSYKFLSTRLICRMLSTIQPVTLDSDGSLALTPSPGKEISYKPKRKKLKGKRAVVRWLKFFRWRKKKELNRMTAEERLLYKLRKVCSLACFLFSLNRPSVSPF